jgi:hypothetical protein
MSFLSNTNLARRFRALLITRGKFVLLRRAVWAFLAVNLLGTLVFISVLSSPSQSINVWFEIGMPSNFIMVRTSSEEKLSGVELVLDGRYFFTKDELAPGTNGLQIERDFLSADETVPVEGYRPEQVKLKIGDDEYEFQLKPEKKIK